MSSGRNDYASLTEPVGKVKAEEMLVRHFHGLVRMWRLFGKKDRDVEEDLKQALVAYISMWALGATLVMTTCVGLLVVAAPSSISDGGTIPFANVTVHLFHAYNFLSVAVSIRAIREAAYALEDISLLPSSLIMQYMHACDHSGGILGPNGTHGPHRWSTFSLIFLRSATLFLVYTTYGPLVGAYSLAIFVLVHSTELTSNAARARMWRSFEWSTWAEHRESHAAEFKDWQNGKGFFWLGGSGWHGGLSPGQPASLAKPHAAASEWRRTTLARAQFWLIKFPIAVVSELFCVTWLKILWQLAFGGSARVQASAERALRDVYALRDSNEGDGRVSA